MILCAEIRCCCIIRVHMYIHLVYCCICKHRSENVCLFFRRILLTHTERGLLCSSSGSSGIWLYDTTQVLYFLPRVRRSSIACAWLVSMAVVVQTQQEGGEGGRLTLLRATAVLFCITPVCRARGPDREASYYCLYIHI